MSEISKTERFRREVVLMQQRAEKAEVESAIWEERFDKAKARVMVQDEEIAKLKKQIEYLEAEIEPWEGPLEKKLRAAAGPSAVGGNVPRKDEP